MKLTGELKEKVAKAESSEEAKKVIEEAGFELSDEELEGIAGGTQKEIDELMEICGGNDDLLGDALRANGVFALLYGGETFQKNHYIDTRASTMKFYSHEAIVEMVRKYVEAQG